MESPEAGTEHVVAAAQGINSAQHWIGRPTRKNVAVVYWATEGDGVASHLRTFTELVAEQGHDVTWFHGSGPDPEIPGVTMQQLDVLDISESGPAEVSSDDVAAALAPFLNRPNTVVHTNNTHMFRWQVAEGIVDLRDRTARPGKEPGAPRADNQFAVVNELHSPFVPKTAADGSSEEVAAKEAEQLVRGSAAVKRVDGAFGVSDYMSRLYEEQLGIGVQPIGIGIPLERFAGVPDITLGPDDPVVFGFAGRDVWNKGLLQVVMAFVQMVQHDWDEEVDGVKPRLRITTPRKSVGGDYERSDGYSELVRQVAAEAGDLIEFEHRTDREMSDFFETIHVNLSVTLEEEARGLVPMQAAISGRDSETTGVGGLIESVYPRDDRRLLGRGPDGEVSPQLLVAELRATMKHLATNRATVVARGAAARLHAEQHFDAKTVATRMTGAYYPLQEQARKDGAKAPRPLPPHAARNGLPSLHGIRHGSLAALAKTYARTPRDIREVVADARAETAVPRPQAREAFAARSRDRAK